MRMVDKELKRVNKSLKLLEECICTPLCIGEKIIPLGGNGCRTKSECGYLKQYFAEQRETIDSLFQQRNYLKEQVTKCRAYAR